ncbi:MAG: alpha/beta fold hydrolase [Pseudomonadales bacterium]|nr:alpha/beta fold hydrolase [Pseudomonadales bacterium]
MVKNFVLVHGAWHGGWCWNEVVALLESQGHRVAAPDLPGHGDDSGGVDDATMENYVARICETIDSMEGKVILVGHSLGGMMISAVAEKIPQRIERLVYLCAFLPVDGESANILGARNLASGIRGNTALTEDRKAVVMNEALIQQVFYHDCSDEQVEYARTRLRPQALEPMGVKLSLGENFSLVPKHYIECIEDQAIHIVQQREMAARGNCSLVTSFNCSHSPFFTSPEAVTIALLSDAE